jgi:hypothetical protein
MLKTIETNLVPVYDELAGTEIDEAYQHLMYLCYYLADGELLVDNHSSSISLASVFSLLDGESLAVNGGVSARVVVADDVVHRAMGTVRKSMISWADDVVDLVVDWWKGAGVGVSRTNIGTVHRDRYDYSFDGVGMLVWHDKGTKGFYRYAAMYVDSITCSVVGYWCLMPLLPVGSGLTPSTKLVPVQVMVGHHRPSCFGERMVRAS